MTHSHFLIAAAAKQLAKQLPFSVMATLAAAIAQWGGTTPQLARQAILECLPTPDFRGSTAKFVDGWFGAAGDLGFEAVALALLTAAQCEYEHKQDERIEVVWTGPETVDTRSRQTEQAILEVVNASKSRLTVVSYAVYRIPRIRDALIAAASRGVNIRLIAETPNRIEGQGEYDCLKALGQNVASVCSVYYWPPEKRGKDDNGKLGILHVKCAVADAHTMFLSSANFTEYAFTINMELGLLITGGRLPAEIDRHFENLTNNGTLLCI